MDHPAQGELFEAELTPRTITVINERCLIRNEDELQVVVVAGVPWTHFAVDDRVARAHAMVSLIEGGWADQKEVARAFQVPARSVRRYQRKYEQGGLTGLLPATPGYPKGRARRTVRDRVIARMKIAGSSNRMIAQRLGIDEKTVRKRLRRLGWADSKPTQLSLPQIAPSPSDTQRATSDSSGDRASSAKQAPASADQTLSAFQRTTQKEPHYPASLDVDPAHRGLDRMFAALGLIEDAAPWFRTGERVPGAGVLLAIPALTPSGVFEIAAEVYGSLGSAFYGLRTTILTLLLMALLRIKRPEALKERSPTDLGRVLGLDRAPEVKTLRRKLTELAALKQAARFGQQLAQRRVALRGEAMGFLYVDGHVRVYYGKHTIPKAHAARMRLSVPATSDYWVNDRQGDPLFVVTAEANAGLVKMLPKILAEARKLLGKRRVTVVFDRGGYSPKLFQALIAARFDILTYRKGRWPRVPADRFRLRRGRVDGCKVSYQLADEEVALLRGKLRMRQVTRLNDEHQTPVLTTRRDLRAIEVAYRMFNRWRQENFFKYMREEYLLDALADYKVEADDPAREVPNPAWSEADGKLRAKQAEVDRLLERYGKEAFSNPEARRPTMRGFKIAQGKARHEIRALSREVKQLAQARAQIPKRIPVGQRQAEPVIKLATERKHLTNLLKMVAYQAESDLFRALERHYKRNEQEGRTLLQTAFTSAADIIPTEDELVIRLAPLSSAHRSQAIAALCRELTATETRFPGTPLRMRFEVGETG
jgi:transposase